MPGPNSPQSKRLLSLQTVYYLLKILCILIPAACALYVWFGPQDIYWEQFPLLPAGSQPLSSARFNIVNASFFRAPALRFTVTVDVPPAQIAEAKTLDETRELLNDLNIDIDLVVILKDKKNKLSGKGPFGNCTTIEISRRSRLAARSAAVVDFLWREGEYVEFIGGNLYSGSSPYYKNYPQKSERHLLAQTMWQLIGFPFVIVIVALMTILMRSLVRTKRDLEVTEQTLGQTNSELTEAERSKTETEEQLKTTENVLATQKAELSKQRTLLDSAHQSLLIREELDRSSSNLKARTSYIIATEGARPRLLPPEVRLPIKDDVAEEYERSLAKHAADMAEANQKPSENGANQITGKAEESGDKHKAVKKKKAKKKKAKARKAKNNETNKKD